MLSHANVNWIKGIVKVYFSRCGLTLTDLRRNVAPLHLECIMLMFNKQYFDARTDYLQPPLTNEPRGGSELSVSLMTISHPPRGS